MGGKDRPLAHDAAHARFDCMLRLSGDFYWETDSEHRLVEWVHGPSYHSMAPRADYLGKRRWEVPSTTPDAAGWDKHRATLDSHQPFRDFEYARLAPDGKERRFMVHGEPMFEADGRFAGYRGVGRDITEIVEARARIAALAYNDALTGLTNRTGLAPALEHAVQLARRYGRKLGLVFLDLDGFKQINDAQGHDAGDQVLVEIGGRLRGCLRASDLVARLGGDEFVVLLEELHDAGRAAAVARKLLAEISRPCTLPDGSPAQVSASVGISILPDDAEDARDLMRHADAAMYVAKQEGKNCYRLYTGRAAAAG
jgi:diguanylate cyclase (GGDEF)-like protein